MVSGEGNQAVADPLRQHSNLPDHTRISSEVQPL